MDKYNFNSSNNKKNLGSKTIKGSLWLFIGQLSSFFITMISTILLARLLTPEQFGLVGMVTVLIKFGIMFKDMGLSLATIQKENVSHEQISNLFWINLIFSFIVFFIFASISPLIVLFYNEKRLLAITILLSLMFPLNGVIVQHQAILSREMRFKSLSIIQIITMLLSTCLALFTAFLGCGYYSIVIQRVSQPLIAIPFFWAVCKWRPSFLNKNVNIKNMLTYGWSITCANMINYFSRNLDNILIGKYDSVLNLGLYEKAYSLLLFPINQIRNPLLRVATPALSRLQENPDGFKNYYLKIIYTVALISMPLMVYLFLYAKEIILILLGVQWSGIVPLFRILSVVGFIQPVSSLQGLVLISTGKGDRFLKLNIIIGISTVISFLIGIRWGAYGIAVAYCVVNYLLILPTFLYAFHKTPIGLCCFFLSITGPISASIFSGVMLLLVDTFFLLSFGIISRILITCILAILFYGIVLFIVPIWRRELLYIIKKIRDQLSQ